MLIIAFELPLNIDGVQILIHMLNLFVLLIVIRIFLYKPIRAFIVKRSEEFERADLEREANLLASTDMKNKYEDLLSNAKQEAVTLSEATLEQSNQRRDEIITLAKGRADEMIRNAEAEIALKSTEELAQVKSQIVEIACLLAEEILHREFKKDDLDVQVDKIIKKWKRN